MVTLIRHLTTTSDVNLETNGTNDEETNAKQSCSAGGFSSKLIINSVLGESLSRLH